MRGLANDAGADAEAAALLASELAANAVLHASSEFEVRVTDDGEAFRVEVVNDAPDMIVSLKEPSEEGGRGLHIVNALALRWGTDVMEREGGLVRATDCLKGFGESQHRCTHLGGDKVEPAATARDPTGSAGDARTRRRIP